MSKKLRNSIIFCTTLSLIAGGCLTLQADTTPTVPVVNDLSSSAAEAVFPETEVSASTQYTPANTKTETIYISLDPYGIPTETQVVNGYRINGASKITDYGHYTNVVNLTNYAKPSVNEDEIIWTLDAGETNFYYQGTLDYIEAPWNFTIRYKLNGVETKAEDLAGASGMIETIIDIVPNDNVSDYLKNNFMLQLSTSYDMGKNLSVEAPDGVMVDLGATRSITFLALPGEAETFHIHVGTESFESSGLNIVMTPLHMSALSEVSDLKDAKSRIEDAFDAANDSLDIILDSTQNVQDGLSSLSSGISSLKDSLHTIRQDDVLIDEKVDKLLEQTTALDTSIQVIPEHLKSAVTFAQDFNTSGNTLVQDLTALKPILEDTKLLLQVLQDDCAALHTTADKLTDTGSSLNNNLDPLKKQLTNLVTDLHSLESALDSFESGVNNSDGSLSSAGSSLSSLSSKLDYFNSLSDEELAELIKAGLMSPEDVATIKKLSGASDSLSNLSSILYDTDSLTDDAGSLASSLKRVSKTLASLSSSLVSVTGNVQSITSTLTSNAASLTDTLDHIGELLAQLDTASVASSNMITDIETIQLLLNNHLPELISLLEDTSTITENASSFTQSANSLGAQLKDTVTSNREHTYNSIDQTLDGSISTFDDIINALNTTDALRANKDIIKNTIDDEWDKLEEDYNLLDYVSDALPVSLISDKNTAVTSSQFILRTPEISVDKKAERKAQEANVIELTVWERIKNIFAKMF